jgi:xylulokinase
MYLGIDLGTSEVKIALLDERFRILGTAGCSIEISRPQANWSEQDPSQWMAATSHAIASLREQHLRVWPSIRSIGLSGQMHGAVVIDENGAPLRPAILWNDGRSQQECEALTRDTPDFYARSGNLAMPGFTAPKILWLRKHEPNVHSRMRKVLLPKDYLRYEMTGEYITDPSDASGTLWLNPSTREWDDVLLAATGLDRSFMPRLCDGSASSARLSTRCAQAWGLGNDVVVAGGAGDNAASAVGVGAISPGRGFLSLGTSGVLFVTSDRHRASPERAIHAFCHTLPGLWHQMTVMLSAASCLSWWKQVAGAQSESTLVAAVEAGFEPKANAPLFLPYLTGERTPHNDANVRGILFGLDASHGTREITYSVLEGVAFGMKQGLDAMQAVGTRLESCALVGGGARSDFWSQLHADVLGVELYTPRDAATAGALGAARLGALAAGASLKDVCNEEAPERVYYPNAQRGAFLAERATKFNALYPRIRDLSAT